MVCMLAPPLANTPVRRKLGLCLSVQVSWEEHGAGSNMTSARGFLYRAILCLGANCTTETRLAQGVLCSRVQYV